MARRTSVSIRIKRSLLFVHRWLGVVLCALFLLWFASGIGMMYWSMPAVSARDRLERAPALDPATIRLSPQEAAEKVGVTPSPAQTRLSSFDGRPVYRFGAGGRGGGGGQIVYADTGEEQLDAPSTMRDRAAAAWTGQPVKAVAVQSVTDIDQWMVGNSLRNLRPLWKYSWPNGEQVYIGESGEVLMYTTTTSRLQAYVSAVPHWLYFTPLRKHQPVWIRVATYSAMIGTGGAILGVILGVWLYSPSKKYLYAGQMSRIPYRGQKRWHTMLGLIFGLATITWTLSGSLAFLPFPTPPRPQAVAAPPQAPAPRAQGQRGGRGGGGGGPAQALRGRVDMADFAVHPRDLIAQHADLQVKELEFSSFAGEPLYIAHLGDGTSRRFSLDGQPIDSIDADVVLDIVKTSVSDPKALETRIVDQYDYYYFDRTRQRPLPVILALTHDDVGTRYYVDPKTATVVGTYSDRNWARRFFYNGLHSLSFPWLYNHRPLWDIVVIAFMLGGMALSTTALVLAWQVLGRKLRRVVSAFGARDRSPAARPGRRVPEWPLPSRSESPE